MVFTNPLEDISKYKGRIRSAFGRWRVIARQSISERFWKKVEIGGRNQCWPFIGNKNKAGYGVFNPKAKHEGRQLAHRMAWIIENGPIKIGYYICHRCDNPICCNPKHLYEGSPRDNVLDSIARGRFNRPKGEDCHSCKLTEQKVTRIRSMFAAGSTGPELGSLFGVNKATIYAIVKRRKWKHVQ